MVTFAFTIFAFLSLTSAVVSNTPLQLIPTTDGNDNITIANNNKSSPLPPPSPANYSISNVSTPASFLHAGTSYICSQTFGSDLNFTSCESALSLIGLDKTVHSFAERNAGVQADLYLPQRFISSDGECAIELVLESSAKIARASAENIAFASFVLARNCVAKEPSSGGIARHIGAQFMSFVFPHPVSLCPNFPRSSLIVVPFYTKTNGEKVPTTSNTTLTCAPWLRENPGGDNNLRIVVEKYKTQNVRCYGRMPAPNVQSSCQQILNTMPVDTKEIFFGPKSDPLVDVVLPYLLLSSQ